MIKHSFSTDSIENCRAESKDPVSQSQMLNFEWELTKTGEIVQCNESCLQELGYNQDELIVLSRKSNGLLSLVHEDDRDSLQMILQEQKAAVGFNLLRFKHKRGAWLHVACNTKLNSDTKNLHFSGLDITHLLRDISFVFNEIRNIIQQLLAVVDACQTQLELPSYSEWMSIGDAVLKNLINLLKNPIHSHQLSGSSVAASPIFSTRSKSTDLLSNVSKKSTTFEQKSTVVDITAKVNTILRDKKDEFQNSPDIHAIIGLQGDGIYAVNAALTSVLGYSFAEASKMITNTSLDYLSLIHDNDKGIAAEAMKTLRAGNACFTVLRIKHRDSNNGYICLCGYAIPDVKLGTVYLIAKNLTPYLTDIRKLIHEARNTVQLIQGGFSEIKTVIASDSKSLPTKQKEIFAIAGQSKICIWNLLNIIQRQTKVEFLAIRPVATNLNESIHRITQLFTTDLTKKSLKLNLFLPKAALYIFDKQQFEGILINILTNALKYTNQGGEITISLASSTINMQKDLLELQVTDTGRGMNATELQHVFELYYRSQETKECASGSGLGLPIVKQIVEKMGGTIKIASQVDQGTRVTLTFTAEKTTATDLKNQQVIEAKQLEFGTLASAASSPSSSPRQLTASIQNQLSIKGLNILTVDDNAINTKIYEKILTDLECSCTKALSGKLAIQQIAMNNSQAKPFDIIFMDISMPEMDGLETTKYIKTNKLAEQTIIIGLSGNTDQDITNNALAAGMVDYITKPVTEKRLEAVIKKNLPKLGKFKQGLISITEKPAKSPRSAILAFATSGSSSSNSSSSVTTKSASETKLSSSLVNSWKASSAIANEVLCDSAAFSMRASNTSSLHSSNFTVITESSCSSTVSLSSGAYGSAASLLAATSLSSLASQSTQILLSVTSASISSASTATIQSTTSAPESQVTTMLRH